MPSSQTCFCRYGCSLAGRRGCAGSLPAGGLIAMQGRNLRKKKHRRLLPAHAMLRNVFSRGKGTTISEIEESVSKLLLDVENNLATLRSAMEKGTAAEADSIKTMMKIDFTTMATATGQIEKMVKEQLEKEDPATSDLLSLKSSADSLRKQTQRIKKELVSMKQLSISSASRRLTPEVAGLVELLKTLDLKSGGELRKSSQDIRESVHQGCMQLQTSLSYGENGSSDLKDLLASIDKMVETENGAVRDQILAFKSGSLASFVDDYLKVFGGEDVVLPGLEEESDTQEGEEMSSNGSGQDTDQGTAPVEAAFSPGNSGSSEKEESSGTLVSPLGATSAAIGAEALLDIDGNGSGKGSGGNDDWGSGGGGGAGDGEEEEEEEAIQATTILWSLLLLAIAYLLLLPLSLKAHKHVQAYWNEWQNRRNDDKEDSPPPDETPVTFESGGVTGWLLSRSKGPKSAPKKQEPIDG